MTSSRTVLLDTGFLVALVSAEDPEHLSCREVWSDVHGRVASVEGVLVEACHLLRRARDGPESALGLVHSAPVVLFPSDSRRLARAMELVRRYRDVPMDFVDAQLVVLAEELGTTEILTLDRRGFATYRAHGSKSFHIRPAAGADSSGPARPRRVLRRRR